MASWRLFTCLGVLSAATVYAHGGLMETQSYTMRRGHPEDQLTSFTRGALISRDGGGSWRWVCAEAMGYGSWQPESYAWLSSGDILTAKSNVLLSNSAQSTRGVLSFIRSFLAATSSLALSSSAPA